MRSRDKWRIIESNFQKNRLPGNETIFTVGNGYIGMRGNLEEKTDSFQDGTYINGFYESQPIIYGETAYGYARNSQTMLNVPDAKGITLWVDGQPFNPLTGILTSHERILDMQRGILARDVVWESPSGVKAAIHTERLVSFHERHLAVITFSVEVFDNDVEIIIESSLDGGIRNQAGGKDPRVGSALKEPVLESREQVVDGSLAAMRHITRGTRFHLVSAMENQLESDNPYTLTTEKNEKSITFSYRILPERKTAVRLIKYITYYTSLDHPADKLMSLSKETIAGAKEKGAGFYFSSQRQYLDDFWEKSDITVEGDPAIQQSLRFNLFHLLQSTGQNGRTSIAAKGLTGEGYEGHYFWDSEIYVLPFFTYTQPRIARKLVEYRYRSLDKARERASEMSHIGALYSWRTINGEECSAYYPAGTAQYHINADIIYAIRRYIEATGDLNFLKTGGAEMLFETARFWSDLGDFIPHKDAQGGDGHFCINCVTGPDEYTAIVNNNTYTNLMAKDHLAYAAVTARRMMREYPEDFQRVAKKISLGDEEIEKWEKAAALMYVPFDPKLAIHPQDDTFLDKAVWDFEGTPKESYPLLLHYHPLVIYRHQVLKQPDVVLALFLQGNRFSTAEKKRNFDYYDPLTTGDSSLAPCIQSVIATEIGYAELAYKYFMKTARIDLEDSNRNVKYGVHTAAMAGTWISLVYGFAGMRDYGGKLSFRPQIPAAWKRLRFSLTVRGCVLEVDIRKKTAVYTLLSGTAISIKHEQTEIDLLPGKPVKISLIPRIEAIIFDLDGVITDSSEYHYRAWKRLADELKIPFDHDYNEKLKGISRMDSLNLILKRSGCSFSQREKEELAEIKNSYYQSLIAKITPDELLPGIGDFFKEIKSSGIKMALASASRNAPDVLSNLKIEKYFDVISNPASLTMGKPDPEIFCQAADLLDIPYRNCAAIEDAQAGITAIRSAGMFSVGIGSRLKGADWKITDTSELTLSELKEQFSRANKKN
jgi:alpha,alpha-trehalose phosphorylase